MTVKKEKPKKRKSRYIKKGPTLNQKKVAKLIVENLKNGKKISGKKILEEAGYGKGMGKHAGQVINSKGVKEELKNLGFTVDNAKNVLGKLIDDPNTEANVKVNVAKEIFKVHGTYAAQKQEISVNKELDEALNRLSKLLPKTKSK